MAIDPTGTDLKAFLAKASDEPVVMLSLLRFVEGGRVRYDDYIAHFRRTSGRFGAEIVYYGYGRTAVVTEAGQEWDARCCSYGIRAGGRSPRWCAICGQQAAATAPDPGSQAVEREEYAEEQGSPPRLEWGRWDVGLAGFTRWPPPS